MCPIEANERCLCLVFPYDHFALELRPRMMDQVRRRLGPTPFFGSSSAEQIWMVCHGELVSYHFLDRVIYNVRERMFVGPSENACGHCTSPTPLAPH